MGKQALPYVAAWHTATAHWMMIVGGIALTTAVVGALLTG